MIIKYYLWWKYDNYYDKIIKKYPYLKHRINDNHSMVLLLEYAFYRETISCLMNKKTIIDDYINSKNNISFSFFIYSLY